MKHLSALVITLIASAALADTIHIPGDYPTIQAGIDAVVDGDTVLVADGTYTGTGNKNIDFLGKAIVVMSENGADNCVIDCESEGRGFYFHSGEDSTSILNGIKMINGSITNGGGIRCDYSSPTIENCIVSDNSTEDYGGGIYCSFSDPIIRNCEISGNSSDWNGGGIFCYESELTIENCEISDNSAFFAGGIWCEQSSPAIENCTFRKNTATWDGGGILVGFDSSPTITACSLDSNSAWRGGGIWCHKSNLTFKHCSVNGNSADCGGGVFCYWDSENTIENCTISGNSAIADGGGIHTSYCNTTIVNTIVEGNTGSGGIYFGQYTESEVTYGDFHDNENGDFTGGAIPPGLGLIAAVNANGDSCDIYNNIFLDPLFYSITGDSAFYLTENSPCIDAGDPESPLDPDGTIADMGTFYFDQAGVIDDLTISIIDDDVLLDWEDIPGAVIYHVYRNEFPYFEVSGMTPIAGSDISEYLDEDILGSTPQHYRVTWE